jgi:serine/threonine protein phosphatase PrpC
VRIVSGGRSDVGQQRANNEDCFRIVQPLNLFVVSDGMGGEAHGEIASAMAVETVVKTCMGEETGTVTVSTEEHPEWSDKTRLLLNAAQLANKKIYESAEANPQQQGMGATLTAAWINEEKLSVVHVGDSRVYLLRSGVLQQLTSDHSLVAEQVRRGILTAAEAEHSELQSVLLRALGTQPEIEVDAEEHMVFPDDILLLCSDGLTRMVTEQNIAATLQSESDPGRVAEKLVAQANENGGGDNITVVVVHMEPKQSGFLSWLRHGARKNAGKNGSA